MSSERRISHECRKAIWLSTVMANSISEQAIQVSVNILHDGWNN